MKVSLACIAYNEEKSLNDLFSDICAQDYPHELIEIVFVDGMSTDNTRKMMDEFAVSHPDFARIVVCENRKRTLPCGWNVFLKVMQGDVIMRWDAHARFSSDFVSKSVACIKSGENVCAGIRPCITDVDNPWNHTLLLAENSLFGSSIAPYRRNADKSEKSYVNSAFHCTYRKEVFAKIGGFDERLARTEDNDINYRIRQAGYKIRFDDSIKSKQIMRGSLRKMIKQKFANGNWVALTLSIQPKCLELYHFVPFVFVLAILLTTAFLLFGLPIFSIILWASYLFVNVVMAVLSIIQNKSFNFFDLLLPSLFLLLHISYGVGTFIGLIKMPFWKHKKENQRCDEIENVRKILNDT